jgi:hypothetical protein
VAAWQWSAGAHRRGPLKTSTQQFWKHKKYAQTTPLDDEVSALLV